MKEIFFPKNSTWNLFFPFLYWFVRRGGCAFIVIIAHLGRRDVGFCSVLLCELLLHHLLRKFCSVCGLREAEGEMVTYFSALILFHSGLIEFSSSLIEFSM